MSLLLCLYPLICGSLLSTQLEVGDCMVHFLHQCLFNVATVITFVVSAVTSEPLSLKCVCSVEVKRCSNLTVCCFCLYSPMKCNANSPPQFSTQMICLI